MKADFFLPSQSVDRACRVPDVHLERKPIPTPRARESPRPWLPAPSNELKLNVDATLEDRAGLEAGLYYVTT